MIQQLLDMGPGLVQLPAGTLVVANLRVPSNVTVQGMGESTTLLVKPGARGVILDSTVGVILRDLRILAGPDITPGRPVDDTDTGLYIRQSFHFQIVGLTIRGFGFASIDLGRTPLGSTQSAFCDGGMLTRLTLSDSATGILFNTRGEYTVLSDSSILRNQVGVIIHAGNCRVVNCSIGSNHDGVWIVDHANGSHGVINGCLINHNTRYALLARDVRNGMLITSCCFFYGAIVAERCRGLILSSCEVQIPVTFSQGECNSFTNNYLIVDPARIQLEPDTRR